MGYVHTRTCCCCIPVRAGAFVVTVIGVLLGVLFTVGGILQAKNKGHRVMVNKVGLVVQIVIYLLLTIVSLFGLVGVIIKRRKFVVMYWVMLVIHLAVSVIASIFSLNVLFKSTPSDISKCVKGSTNTNDIKDCQKAMTMMKGIAVAVCIIIWLIEIYACIIVDSYVKQLADEEDQTYKPDTESGPVRW